MERRNEMNTSQPVFWREKRCALDCRGLDCFLRVFSLALGWFLLRASFISI